MDGIDEVDCREERPAESHQACENIWPRRTWKPTGRAQAQPKQNSAAGLRLDTLGTISISSDHSSGYGGNTQGAFHGIEMGQQHQEKSEHAILEEMLQQDEARPSNHDRILEEEEQEEDEQEEEGEGNGDFFHKIPKEETLCTVCEQAARNISEILGAELRGGLQAVLREVVLGAELRGGLQAVLRKEILGAELRGGLQAVLREEVSQAVRQEFQRCPQELRELEPQRLLVENGCQADDTTVPVRYARSDGDLSMPTGASFRRSQTSSTPMLPGLPVLPHPWEHTEATAIFQKPSLPMPGNKASHGRKLTLRKHEDEAHHHTSCSDSIVPGVSSRAQPVAHHIGCADSLASGVSSTAQPATHHVSCSASSTSGASNRGQSIVNEKQSVESVQEKSLPCEVRELLQQQGLARYAPDRTLPKRSGSSPETQTGPVARPKSSSRTRKSPAPQVSRRACLIDADPREHEEGTGAKPPTHLSKKDCCELGSLEHSLALEGDKKEGSSFHLSSPRSSRENKHTQQQDAGSRHRCGARYTSEDSCHSSRSRQSQPCSKRTIQRSLSSNTSMHSSEEVICLGTRTGAAECATPAVHRDNSISGSPSPSSSRSQRWFKLNSDCGVPVVRGLIRQPSSNDDDGELDSIALGPPRDASRRCSWFTALAEDVCSLFGGLVVPTCAILPWEQAYPWASTFYQWIILGLVGKCLYHSVTLTYQEWEMDESSGAVVSALDSVMGTGALMGILACGALWRSTVLVHSCKLLMAYLGKSGIVAYWDEVSAVDFLCTASFWLASVLVATLESLYFEVFATTEDLISHVGCFALFAFVLVGMSQFVIHKCRCLTKLIDTFCYHTIKQPHFAEALSEWGLLQAVCRKACDSIQFAFLSLQATATAVVLLSIQQVGRHDASRLMALAPGLIVAMGIFRSSLWAAAVTDMCIRVPRLVNSVSVERLLDQDRMYTVHYIVYSQAGFYIFNLRLTSSTVLKTAYVACAVTFYLASKVFED